MERVLSIDLTILNYNKLALDSSHAGDFEKALKLYSRAQSLLKPNPNPYLHAITLNNLACLYSTIHAPTKALRCLEKSLLYESSDHTSLAGTHLNICALKSGMNQHEEALTYALSALSILKNNFEYSKQMLSTLIIAYHSTGTEYFHLDDLKKAIVNFKFGMDLAIEELGNADPLTKTLTNAYKKALRPVKVTLKEKEKDLRSKTRAKSGHNARGRNAISAERAVTGYKFRKLNQEPLPKLNVDFARTDETEEPTVEINEIKKEKKSPRKTKDSLVLMMTKKKKNKHIEAIEKKIDDLQEKITQFQISYKPLKDIENTSKKKLTQINKKRAARVITKYLKVWVFMRNRSARILQREVRSYLKHIKIQKLSLRFVCWAKKCLVQKAMKNFKRFKEVSSQTESKTLSINPQDSEEVHPMYRKERVCSFFKTFLVRSALRAEEAERSNSQTNEIDE